MIDFVCYDEKEKKSIHKNDAEYNSEWMNVVFKTTFGVFTYISYAVNIIIWF